jgi:hypothetical protein
MMRIWDADKTVITYEDLVEEILDELLFERP